MSAEWKWDWDQEGYVYISDELDVSMVIFEDTHEYELVVVLNRKRHDFLLSACLRESKRMAKKILATLKAQDN